VDSGHIEGQLEHVLLSEEQLLTRIEELANQIAADYPEDEELLLVGVLKGAVMVMADLARACRVKLTWTGWRFPLRLRDDFQRCRSDPQRSRY